MVGVGRPCGVCTRAEPGRGVRLPVPRGGLWTPVEVSNVFAVPLAPSEALRGVLAASRAPYRHEAVGASLRAPVAERAWRRAVQAAARALRRRPTAREVHRALVARGAVARVADEGIEAFVSSAYVAFDDDVAFSLVVESIERSLDPLVRALLVREISAGSITTMRLTSPKGAFEARDGDVFEPGIFVANSSDGTCPFIVAPAWWRVACGNWMLGLRAPAALRLAHRGRRERFERDLHADLMRSVLFAHAQRDMWRLMNTDEFDRLNERTRRAKRLCPVARISAEGA